MPTDETQDRPDPRTSLLDDFDLNWTPDRLDEVARGLPASADRRETLLELVLIDIERQWQRGSRPRVEDYLTRFPELGTPADPPTELLRAELQAREWYGDTASLAGAERRSPAPADRMTTVQAESAHPESRPLTPPGYEILGELGRGGMGVVYKARDVRLNRVVALKTVLVEGGSQWRVARFWAEAEVMAAVRHPNVVQVYELGEHAGRPFLAMECLPGGTLARRLAAATRLPPLDAAVLVGKIAAGVAAAHALGIVHRDLKPGNVLLDAAGEPKVTDFGLAKRQSADLTQTYAMMGTPAYMAPEQAAGRAKFVGPAADVWALGVLLYECVAGRRPFTGATAEALLSQIQSAEPLPLRARLRGVPRDLATIVGKCLSKEPEHRYPTAAELADDLGRFTRGEPIVARPVGPAERLLRWVRRKPTAAAAYALAALAAALVGIVLVVGGLWRDAEGARHDAVSARDEAVRSRGLADLARGDAETALVGEQAAKANEARLREDLARLNYARTVDLAHREWKENNTARAIELLDRCRPDLRGWEWRHVHRLCHSDLLTISGHAGAVNAAAYSPDGSRILTGGDDRTARLWDAETGKPLTTFRGHTGAVAGVVLSPDGKRVATAGRDRTARVWDADTGKQILTLDGHTGQLNGVAFSPDGKRIATAADDRTARVWDAETGKFLFPLDGHTTNYVRSVAFSRDGRRILTGSTDHTSRLWDAATGKEVQVLRGASTTPVYSAGFDSGGKRVVTGGSSGLVRLWAVTSGNEIETLRGHTGFVFSAAFSPDEKLIASAGSDRTVRIWATLGSMELVSFRGHTDTVQQVAFRPDGQRVVSAGRDGTARVWNTTAAAELRRLFDPASGGVTFSAAVSPDGARVVTGGSNGVARVWEADTGKLVCAMTGPAGMVSVAFSPDGARVATAAGDQTARIWDASSGKPLATLTGHIAPVSSLGFDPAGARLVTSGGDDTVRVWDGNTGKQLALFREPSSAITGASFSPDGTRVVATGRDGARIWDVVTERPLSHFRGHTGAAVAAAFNPDGTRVVSAGLDNTARIWDASTGAELVILSGHSRGVFGAAFSVDGRRVFTTSVDGTARVWDATTGHELLTLPGGSVRRPVPSLSRDGTRLLVCCDDGAMIWDSSPVNRGLARPGE